MTGPDVSGSELGEAAESLQDMGAASFDLLDLATKTAYAVLRLRFERDIEAFLTALDNLA